MAQIEVADGTHDTVRLLSKAWGGISEGAVIQRVLSEWTPAPAIDPHNAIAIHSIYRAVRSDATYDRTTRQITIKTGPLAGTGPYSVSGSAVALVKRISPTVHPERNGWNFWKITATGKLLQSIRSKMVSADEVLKE
jgi:hypothetical protein